MLKREITYENPFTKEPVTETHYFHISKAVLIQMEMSDHKMRYEKDGVVLTGFQAKLQRISDAEDGEAIMVEIEDMIKRSYGLRDDKDRFLRSKEIWEGFAATEAYSQLFWELCMNSEKAAEFINNVFPSNMDELAAEVQAEAARQLAARGEPSPEIAAVEKAAEQVGDENGELKRDITPRLLTQTEVLEMDGDDLKSGLATGRYKLS